MVPVTSTRALSLLSDKERAEAAEIQATIPDIPRPTVVEPTPVRRVVRDRTDAEVDAALSQNPVRPPQWPDRQPNPTATSSEMWTTRRCLRASGLITDDGQGRFRDDAEFDLHCSYCALPYLEYYCSSHYERRTTCTGCNLPEGE